MEIDLSSPLRSIVILGESVETWMAAAFFSKLLSKSGAKITVITTSTPTTSKGVSSVQPIFKDFLQFLDIDETVFMKQTSATFKLADFYSAWNSKTNAFFHSFGHYGVGKGLATFHQAYLYLKKGTILPSYDQFSFCAEAAKLNLFGHPDQDENSILSSINYSWHFDKPKFVKMLVEYCKSKNVDIVYKRQEEVRSISATAQSVGKDPKTIEADLYINCHNPFSGKHLSPPSNSDNMIDWQSAIPTNLIIHLVQHGKLRNYLCDVITSTAYGCENIKPGLENIDATLFSNSESLDQKHLDEFLKSHNNPEFEEFNPKPFRLKNFWVGNIIYIGPSSISLPTHCVSNIDLTWQALRHLIKSPPERDTSSILKDEYNRVLGKTHDNIKDYVQLQHITNDNQGKYWKICRSAQISDQLRHKIDLYKKRGRLPYTEEDIFNLDYQLGFLVGTNFLPLFIDPLVMTIPKDELLLHMKKIRIRISEGIRNLENHEEYLFSFLKK